MSQSSKKPNTAPSAPALKSRQQKKRVKTATVSVGGKDRLVYTIPKCVQHYLSASINPFDTPPGACLPCDLLPLPSQKCVGIARGSFATGTSGFGMIQLVPCMANDASLVGYTTSASVGGSSTVYSAFTGIGTSNPLNLPYSVAQIAAGIPCRAVSYGIRVRCTASAMSRGGSYVIFESPDHFSAADQTFTTAKSSPYGRTYGIPILVDSDQWDVSVCSSGPVDPRELQFNSFFTGFPSPLSPDALSIGINSASPGMTFDFEAVIHCEYIGTTPGSLRTASHASPTGFASTIEALKEHTVTNGPVTTESGPSIMDRFKRFFLEEGPTLMSMAGGAVRSAFGDESGLAAIAGGGLKLLADSYTPARDTRAYHLDTLDTAILTGRNIPRLMPH